MNSVFPAVGARPVTHGRHGSMARRSSSLRAGQALHVAGALIAPAVARAAPLQARVRCIVRVVPPRHGSCSAVHPVQFNSSASTYCIVLGTRKAANCAIHCSSGFCREPHESRPCELSEVRPRVRESRLTTTTTTSGLLSYGGVEPSIEAEQV